MQPWVPAALVLACCVSAAGGADAASCGPKKNRNCFDAHATVDFSSVPDISKQIVSEEPASDKPSSRTVEAPPITTYTGPTVGVSPMARAPTVGYYWSLEPEAAKPRADTPGADKPGADTH